MKTVQNNLFMPLKKLILIVLTCLPAYFVFAQQGIPPYQFELDNANKAFNAKKYNTAANLFKKVYPKIKVDTLKQNVLFMIAESYRLSNNYNQAIKWFEDAINSKYPDPSILYSYGNLLKYFERYDDANRTFYDYLFEVPDDKKAQVAFQSCAIAQQWKANPQKFNITPIKEINTEFSDYAPFYSNGKLFWSSSRKESQGSLIFEWTGQKMCDIFEVDYNNSVSTKPNNVNGKVNSNYNDGASCTDTTGNTMYFTQCNGIDGKGINCKIYVSYKQNGLWSQPTLLPFNSDSFSCGHPSISADGKKLYFASDMPNGFGEKDIYVSQFDEVKAVWLTPKNLGPQINTIEDDMFPYISEDNELYYSTKGKIGLGGLDIFKTTDSSTTYKTPVNLQYPINSGGDDFGISFIPKWQQKPEKPIAFYSSNRINGMGDDDIYTISIKPFVFLVKGKVFDRESSTLLSKANVTLTSEKGSNIFTIATNDKGEFTGEIPLNAIQQLLVTKASYFASTPIDISSLGLQKDSLLELTIYLDPIPAPEVDFTLQGILYDVDKYDLRPESKVILDSLAIILRNNPSITIEIGSHTDSRAPADYNLELSKKRAQSCVNYLLAKGIAKDRLVAVGYGETKLVNDCADDVDCTEEQHQQNRRTTFRVLKTDYKK
ncbi:MAG: OmpA family protein [Bacteroidota bacterium]